MFLLDTGEKIVAGDDDFVWQMHAIIGVFVDMDTNRVLAFKRAMTIKRPPKIHVVLEYFYCIGWGIFIVWFDSNLDISGMSP